MFSPRFERSAREDPVTWTTGLRRGSAWPGMCGSHAQLERLEGPEMAWRELALALVRKVDLKGEKGVGLGVLM